MRKLTVAVIVLLIVVGNIGVAQNRNYVQNFEYAWQQLAEGYGLFELKGIDWQAVHQEFAPRFQAVRNDEQFIRELREMVYRLRDAHSDVSSRIRLQEPEQKCIGARLGWTADDRVVVVNVDPNSSAAQARLRPGTIVKRIDGQDAFEYMEALAKAAWERGRWASSPHRARMWQYRYMPLLGQPNSSARLAVQTGAEPEREATIRRDASYGYPRIYVPPPNLQHIGYVSYALLEDGLGYMHMRSIMSVAGGPDIYQQLDTALGALRDTPGLILDLRGNGGGGYGLDVTKRFPSAQMIQEGGLPPAAYAKPIVIIIDAGTFSAGETFATYFIDDLGSPAIGETTAGSSSAKASFKLPNGLAEVQYSARGRRGHWDKMIEFYGVPPTVEVHVDPESLLQGKDNFIVAARQKLLEIIAAAR